MTEDLTKMDITLLVLLIFCIGAYFGASYADDNWRSDMKYFSESGLQFTFDEESNVYYTITQHNNMKYINGDTIINSSEIILP